MPHIHTEPGQYDFTASAFVIRTDFEVPKVMLHWHKKIAKYLQFGGHIELDETPWQAVQHELLEESGYEMRQLQILQPEVRLKASNSMIVHPQPIVINTHEFKSSGHFHTDISYALVTDQEPLHPVAEGESTDIKLFTAQELKDTNIKIGDNVREIAVFVIEELLDNWVKVDTSEFRA